MKSFLIAVALTCGAATLPALAQTAPKPKSPGERDALMAVQKATTADERMKAIENVLAKYADSDYKPMLMVMAMETSQQKGDYAQTTFYAKEILAANPKDAVADVTLAEEIARHTKEFDLDKNEKLAEAEKYANAAITDAPNMPKTRADLTEAQWASYKKDVGAQAHEALGMIALVRKKPDVAITEFKTSIDSASQPDPATYVRLGQAYTEANKLDDAMAAYDKAIATPNVNPQVKQVAETNKADVMKKKGAAPK